MRTQPRCLARRWIDQIEHRPIPDVLGREGSTLGPLINAKALARVAGWTEEALEARVLCGGRAPGAVPAPAVPTDAAVTSPLCRAQVAGPVSTVWSVPDPEDAPARLVVQGGGPAGGWVAV